MLSRQWGFADLRSTQACEDVMLYHSNEQSIDVFRLQLSRSLNDGCNDSSERA